MLNKEEKLFGWKDRKLAAAPIRPWGNRIFNFSVKSSRNAQVHYSMCLISANIWSNICL